MQTPQIKPARPNRRFAPTLPGMVYGRLTVIRQVQRVYFASGQHQRRWECKCSCGTICVVNQPALRSGKTQSCGCRSKEMSLARFVTHGHSKGKRTGTYNSWQAMKKRCLNPKEPAYPNYGGRGITVCKRWLESFQNFLDDMGECPEGMTIERGDNSLGYYKENCRWATYLEQGNNKRNNVFMEYMGENLTVSQWAIKLNIPAPLIYQRLDRGWPFAKIVTTPVRKGNYRRNPASLTET